MKYAIEAYFDRDTEAALAHLAGRVAEEGISTKFLEWKSRPHITLACYNDIDEADCIPKLKAFAAAKGKLPIAFHSVGMFTDTGTIFASPVGNGALFALQRELHAVLCGYDATGWDWYLPDRWTPHCTLALTGEDGERAYPARIPENAGGCRLGRTCQNIISRGRNPYCRSRLLKI